MPITSSNISIQCCIPPKNLKIQKDIKVEIEVTLPYTVLLQKLDFQLDEQFCKEDFAKVFLFNKMLRRGTLEPQAQFHDSLIISQKSITAALQNQAKFQTNPSNLSTQIDLELEALRNEVLNCGNSSLAGDNDPSDSNKHSIKVCTVGTAFKLVLIVSENFGVDLTSAKDHPNKELQEDLRSLSRTMMQESESEVAGFADEGKIQGVGNINQLQSHMGQLEKINQESLPVDNSRSQQNNTDNLQNGIQGQKTNQSRNMKQKQHQSFLEKAVNDHPISTRATVEDEQLRQMTQQEPQQNKANRDVEKLFKRAFQQIVQGLRFYAWPCFRIPQANNLIPLMNASFLLANSNRNDEKRDCDFLIALSMMSGRKFIQAAEQFRKLENQLFQNQQTITQSALDKAIQLEILIADSMNQHSQLSEKINAFQRAVDLSLKQKIKPQNKSNHIHQLREEEAYKLLMMMHPLLIKILLQNIDTKIEAIKVAVLRNIEFLIDQLGCSLDTNLIHILVGVINTYPRSNLHFNNSLLQNQKLPTRFGFFQQQATQAIYQNLFPQAIYQGGFQGNFDYAIANSYLDSILYDSSQENELMIKDGQNFQQTYQQSIKNLQNHILESFISLLSSMSSQVLHHIFNEVIQKSIFLGNNPFENQLATDLRIYLLKFADKIINICQGDLILTLNFINNIVQTMIPDQRKLQNAILSSGYNNAISLQNQVEIAKAKQKTSETISLACHNLWQTCRSKLFINYSNKGFKLLLEWVFNNLVNLAENSDSLTQDEQQKLTLVFDMIDLLAQQQSAFQDHSKENESSGDALEDQLKRLTEVKNHQIHSLSGRETRINTSRMGDHTHIANNNDPNSSTIKTQSLIRTKNKSLSTLELYALINPILFWLDFSIEKLDRLNLFKMIWKTLNKVLILLPEKSVDIDSASIILPVLQKVNSFCQQSSPPLEMLQFLQIVFQDFIKQKKHKSSKDLIKFLDTLLITIAKCIPHNLHEEVFMVCEQILEIMKLNLKEEHIQGVINALIDKYTMRSKAHKRLAQYFINLVLETSMQQINTVSKDIIPQRNQPHQDTQSYRNNSIVHGLQINHQNNTQQNAYSNLIHQQDPNDYMDNYEYERDSNNDYIEDDDDQSLDHIQDFHYQTQQQQQVQPPHGIHNQFMSNPTNQDYNESPLSQRILHQQLNQLNNLHHENQQHNQRQVHERVQNIRTQFDIFISISLFANIYEYSQLDKHREHINLELYFEKLSLFSQMIKVLQSVHIPLFCRLVNQSQFKDSMIRVLQNERSPINAIELLEQLSNFYMVNCAPKNIYEHPIHLLHQAQPFLEHQQQPQFRQNNNNQTSQSSGHQQQQQNYLAPHTNNRGESSRTSFLSNSHNNNNNVSQQFQLRNQFSTGGQQNQINNLQPQQQQVNIQHQQIPIHQVYRYQQNHLEDDLLVDNLNDEAIHDELDIINKERLILIQVHALFIRYCVEQHEKNRDAYLQFHTLNMLDSLYSNLVPGPNFQNLLIKQTLQRGRLQYNQMNTEAHQYTSSFMNQNSKVHHHEIPDFEKFIIIENSQTHQQLLSQQQHLSKQQQQSFVLSEFECLDLKYLHGRLQFAMKIWNFIEESLLQSSWSNIKSICYGVFCQILKIDILEMKQSFQNKLKQVLFPLLNSLLFSKESESKAGGLNILGSFCGFGNEIKQFHHFNLNENLQQFRKNSNFISLALWQQVFTLQEDWDPTIREAASVLIQICAPRESIKHFNRIVKEKYQLKIQSMIKTYNTVGNHAIRQKQYLGSKQQSICQTPSVMINNSESVEEFKIGQDFIDGITERNSHQAEERKSVFRNYMQSTQSMRGLAMGSQNGVNTERLNLSNHDDQNNSSSSEERVGGNTNNIINLDSSSEDYFYVDQYNEIQIKELIGIFRNDYKPPKNLWIEKNAINNNLNSHGVGSEYIDLNQQNENEQGANIMDVFEDRIVDRLNKMNVNNGVDTSSISLVIDQYFKKQNDGENQKNTNAQGESEYLIFERHFESDKEKLGSSLIGMSDNSKDKNGVDNTQNLDNMNHEDLGIIDLDEDDGADEFDELDDDKLPILKNTYSKKHRPNNSKSVAIGSRTQEMQLKARAMPSLQQDIFKEEELKQNLQSQIANIENSQDNVINEEDEIIYSLTNDIHHHQNSQAVTDQKVAVNLVGSALNQQDHKIDEYEQRIAQTIQDLNQQLKFAKEISSPKQQRNQPLDEVTTIMRSPQFQITATVKLHKRNDDNKLMLPKDRPKSNKSFELKHKKGVGLSSPLRPKDSSSSNITQLNLIDLGHGIDKHEILSQMPLSTTIMSQNFMKKDHQSFSRPQLLSNTSPGPLLTQTLNPASTKQSTSVGKSNQQFGMNTSTARKRKSDYQRKSDVPPYSTLASKKLTTSSLSQVTNQNQEIKSSDIKSQNPPQFLSQSQVNNNNNQSTTSNDNNSSLAQQKKSIAISQPQASLMQKAKQAFVSRAKSQSYLNNVVALGSSNSFGSNTNMMNQGYQKRRKEGSFKLSNATNHLGGLINKSLPSSLSGTHNQKGMIGRMIKLTNDEISNSACSGGAQIHKGYFSNDECDRLINHQKINGRKILSPPRSGGDLHNKSKHSFSSEENDNNTQIRASSHNYKRKQQQLINANELEISKDLLINNTALTVDDQINQRISESIKQERNRLKKLKKTRRIIQKDSSSQNLSADGSIYLTGGGQGTGYLASQELSQTDDSQIPHYQQPLPQQMLQQHQMLNQPLQFYPQDDGQELDDDEEDIEEFGSADDSARGTQVKQLSSIDEEEDVTERKTIVSVTSSQNNQQRNQYSS